MTVTATPRRGRRRKNDDTEAKTTAKAAKPDDAKLRALKLAAERTSGFIDAVTLFVQLPLSGLAAAEQRRLGPEQIGALTLDLSTIETYKAPIAGAVVELADNYPVLGTLLDRIAKATPFGTLFGLCVNLTAQLAENHRALPAQFQGLSTVTPREDLEARLLAEAAEAAEAEAARQAAEAPESNGRRNEPAGVRT